MTDRMEQAVRALVRIGTLQRQHPGDLQHLLACSIAEWRVREVARGDLRGCVAAIVCADCEVVYRTELWPNDEVFAESTGLCGECFQADTARGEGA